MNLFDYIFNFDYLIPYIEIILPMSLIITISLAIVPFMNKKYVARARYYVWLIIALRLLMPFDISIGKEPVHVIQAEIPNYSVHRADVIEYEKQMRRQENILGTENIDNDFTANVENTVNENIPQENSNIQNIEKPLLADYPVINFQTVIAYLWGIGSLSILLFNCLQYMLAKRNFRKHSGHDEKSQIILDTLCEKQKINRKLTVYRCSSITTAMIVGVFKPVIYLPDMDFDDSMLEMMLRHELMHYRRKDIIYKFILLLACCVHWFNPLVWLMDRQAQKDIEISCDEDVIRGKSKEFKSVYSDSIMSMVKMGTAKRLAFSTGFANDKKTLVQRFKNIYDSTVKTKGRPVVAMVLALSVMGSALVSCSPVDDISENFEIPQQAMEFIEMYCLNNFDDNYWGYENFDNGLEFIHYYNLFKEEDVYMDGSRRNYSFYPVELLDIYQFMYSDEMPAEWWTNAENDHFERYYNFEGYLPPALELNLISSRKIDDTSFTAVFSRIYDGIPFYDIQFTMVKETVEELPEHAADKFAAGDEIWRIKEIQLIKEDVNTNPQVIEIGTVEEFLRFADEINTNGYNCAGNTYVLTNDLDLTGVKINPIGQLLTPSNHISSATGTTGGFNATFDGQGYTISNLELDYSFLDNENNLFYHTPMSFYTRYAGLFCYIGETGVVKNLNVVNANIAPDPDTERTKLSGIGILAGRNDGTIDNCNVSGVVKGFTTVGGLAGDLSGTVTNCASYTDVQGSNVAGCFAGSIYQADIKNCFADGTATGVRHSDKNYGDTPYRIGGFAGSVICSKLDSCHSEAYLNITSTGYTIGAFTATCETAEMINCVYNAENAGNWDAVDYYRHTGSEEYGTTFEVNPL